MQNSKKKKKEMKNSEFHTQRFSLTRSEVESSHMNSKQVPW